MGKNIELRLKEAIKALEERNQHLQAMLSAEKKKSLEYQLKYVQSRRELLHTKYPYLATIQNND